MEAAQATLQEAMKTVGIRRRVATMREKAGLARNRSLNQPRQSMYVRKAPIELLATADTGKEE